MTGTDPIEITEVIDCSPFGSFQWTIGAISFFLMMLDTMNLTLISFAVPAIAADWGVRTAALTPVFAAGLIGSFLGAIVLGGAADSVGRRWMIIACVTLFGLFTLVTPLAHSVGSLFVYRFLTGIGLGGLLPNIIAMTSEYSPARIRPLVISVMSCGLPVGSLLAGVIAAALMEAHGWKAIFYVGGIVPALLVPLLVWRLPESVRFLALKKNNAPEIARILGEIAPAQNFSGSDRFVIREAKASGSPVRGLFIEGRLTVTLLLWVAFFVSYLTLFLLISWLPSLLHESGIPLQRAIVASAVFFLGGAVGGITLARISSRFDSRRVIAWGFVGAVISTATLGLSHASSVTLFLNLFLAGTFVIGTQITMYAVASASYPTVMRSTGLGWATGVGRIGSIIGPVVTGLLLSGGMPITKLFFMTALPSLAGAAAAFLLSSGRRAEIVPPVAVI